MTASAVGIAHGHHVGRARRVRFAARRSVKLSTAISVGHGDWSVNVRWIQPQRDELALSLRRRQVLHVGRRRNILGAAIADPAGALHRHRQFRRGHLRLHLPHVELARLQFQLVGRQRRLNHRRLWQRGQLQLLFELRNIGCRPHHLRIELRHLQLRNRSRGSGHRLG